MSALAFHPSSSARRPGSGRLRRAAACFAAGVLALVALGAQATPPPAGTSISNQASATYTDSQGVSHTVTSNVVQTTVQQVASLTLTQNGAQNATAGSVAYYPHTLTNTGNGSDTFNLTSANAGGFTMSTVQIYADNGSGQPTGSPITSSGLLNAGATFRFIVAATLPGTATAAQTNALTVTATSVFDATKTGANTDTTTVTNNAVVSVTKAVSAASGAAGSGPYTYTLTYTNTGNSTATAVALSDAIPAGMTYVAASGRWSVTGATALSDSGGTSGTAPNTITSTYTAGSNTFAATVAQVPAGQSGTVSFQVNVAAATAAGVLSNTATYSYNNGAGTTVPGSSNTVPFTVRQGASLTLTGQTVAGPAAPGAMVSFTNTLTNTGNATDTFNVTTGTSTFPAGTTLQLFKSDGVTPLTDTNGDGTSDTGPVAAGATYNVIVKATLPPNATNTGAPFRHPERHFSQRGGCDQQQRLQRRHAGPRAGPGSRGRCRDHQHHQPRHQYHVHSVRQQPRSRARQLQPRRQHRVDLRQPDAAGRLDGDLQGRRWRGQLLDHGSHDHHDRRGGGGWRGDGVRGGQRAGRLCRRRQRPVLPGAVAQLGGERHHS